MFELEHAESETRPVDRFRFEVEHRLADGGDIGFRVSHANFDDTLLPEEWLAMIADEASLTATLLAAADVTVGYEEGAGEQERTVLPNAAQECHRRRGAPEEEAAHTARVEALRTRLTGYVRRNSGALLRAVAGLYPFSNADCAVPYAGAT
jgi:hypothetical protein